MRVLRLCAPLARRQPVRRFAIRGPAEAKLFVRNLPSGATAVDVRRAFEAVCTVRDTSLPVDRLTGRPRGFAFVTLAATDCDAARRAMDGATMGNRKIAVQLASTTSKAPAPTTSTTQRSGSKAAAINERLILSTAGDVLSLFEAEGGDFNHVNFATSLHRLGKLSRSFEKSSTPLLRKIVDRATSSIINESDLWKSRELSNACWGIAKIGNIQAPALFDAVAAEAPKKIATFNSHNLANTAWAYAKAGVEAPLLFEAIALRAQGKVGDFTPSELASTVWAFSAAGAEAPELLAEVALRIEGKVDEFSADSLSQLLLVSIHLRLEAPRHPLALLLARHEPMLVEAHLRREPPPTRAPRDVSKALVRRHSWEHEFQHVTGEGLVVDMADASLKVGVEFDGPGHYTFGSDPETRSLDGASRFKERLLHGLGWTLVRVPYYKWGAFLLKQDAARERYLKEICEMLEFSQPSAHKQWSPK